MGQDVLYFFAALFLAIAGIASISWIWYSTLVGLSGARPRSVEMRPGTYEFRDGKYIDVGLEWRPVEELFR